MISPVFNILDDRWLYNRLTREKSFSAEAQNHRGRRQKCEGSPKILIYRTWRPREKTSQDFQVPRTEDFVVFSSRLTVRQFPPVELKQVYIDDDDHTSEPVMS